MRHTRKPIRACHTCPMNMGDTCWAYANPRARWSKHGQCSAFENAEVVAIFEKWQKQPQVKTRQQIRREFYLKHQKTLPQPYMEKHT